MNGIEKCFGNPDWQTNEIHKRINKYPEDCSNKLCDKSIEKLEENKRKS